MQSQTPSQLPGDPNTAASRPASQLRDVVRSLSPDTILLYEHLSQYPFDSDHEYQIGLAAILGHPDALATREEIEENEELVLQAQCFYYTRKFGTEPIQPSAYRLWREASSKTGDSSVRSGQENVPTMHLTSHGHVPISAQEREYTTSTSNVDTSASSQPEQPPYPSTFANIVDMIVQNKPVPGIEQVPDTVLEPGASKVDNTQRRRKPWESTQSSNIDPTMSATVDTNGVCRKEEGVLKILQPGAIPDSGLLSKE